MICIVCGEESGYVYHKPIDIALSKTWKLSEGMINLFNRREGSICKTCGSNIRAQGLAQAILESKFGYGALTLREWVKKANRAKLKVLEMNACHELHRVLASLKYLTYAEYGTDTEEDIEKLSYPDKVYDLVLHSETLEHVNNPRQALDECRRVLRSDGLVLFSTPILWSRKTITRARMEGSKINKILPASYHGRQTDDYLVYSEFGSDIDSILHCNIARAFPRDQNYIFITDKAGADHITWYKKVMFYILEKTYERTTA